MPPPPSEPTIDQVYVDDSGVEHVWYGDYTIVPTIPQYSASMVN